MIKEFVKRAIKIIIDFCLAIFILYSFIAILITTTDLINEWLHIDNGGIIAFIIILVFIYGLIKKYMDK